MRVFSHMRQFWTSATHVRTAAHCHQQPIFLFLLFPWVTFSQDGILIKDGHWISSNTSVFWAAESRGWSWRDTTSAEPALLKNFPRRLCFRGSRTGSVLISLVRLTSMFTPAARQAGRYNTLVGFSDSKINTYSIKILLPRKGGDK